MPRRVAVVHQHSERPHAIETLDEGVPPDSVEHGRDTLRRNRLHRGDKIDLSVEHHVIAAVGLGDFGLFLRAGGADHGRAEMLRPLAKDGADAAGRGMDQDRFARFRPNDPVDDQGCGEAFDHHRRRLPVGYAGRELDQALGRDVACLRISTGLLEELAAHAGIGDTIASAHIGDVFADALDHAGGLIAQDHRKPQRARQVEAAATHIDVGIVDSDRGVADARFTPAEGWKRDVLPAHHLRPAVGVNADGFGHDDARVRARSDTERNVKSIALGDALRKRLVLEYRDRRRRAAQAQLLPARHHVVVGLPSTAWCAWRRS